MEAIKPRSTLTVNIKTEEVLSFLFAIYALFKLSPYFLWKTFNNGAFERMFGGIQTANMLALVILFISIWELIKRGKVIARDFGLMALVLVSGLVIIHISGRDNVMYKAWINYLILGIYLLSGDIVKRKSFKYFKYIFAITLLPALFWHLFANLLGASFSYTSITPTNETKVAYEYTYRHYFGAVQIFGEWDSIARFRFNGIYDEPGVVGSVAGLLLTNSLMKKDKDPFINVLLLVEGLLSLSLAFIMFLVIYYVSSNLINRKTKGLIFIIGLIVLYFLFININFSNEAISSLQSRLRITSTGLSGDNRTSTLFDTLYSKFKHSSDFSVLMFGCGPEAIETIEGKSCSYRNIIYDYGYIVFILFIAFIIIYICTHRKKENDTKLLVFLLLILGNVYQRAGLFYFPYMLILIGGVTFLQEEQSKTALGVSPLRTRKKLSLKSIKVQLRI